MTIVITGGAILAFFGVIFGISLLVAFVDGREESRERKRRERERKKLVPPEPRNWPRTISRWGPNSIGSAVMVAAWVLFFGLLVFGLFQK